jgi:hypothetical protein
LRILISANAAGKLSADLLCQFCASSIRKHEHSWTENEGEWLRLPFTLPSTHGFLLAGHFQLLKSENQMAGFTHGIDIFVPSLDRDSIFIKIDR